MRWHAMVVGMGFLVVLATPALADDALMSPDNAKPGAASHNDEGVSHYSQGHWKVALEHFEGAAKADPKFAEAHFNLGLTFDKMGKHKEATEHFKKAAELGKNNKKIQESETLKDHVGN